MSSGKGYRFDRFVLNLERGCLQEGGADVELRPKAFEVLRQLVDHAGRLMSKDELMKAVWPNVFVNDDALAQCIRDVRKALGDDGERFIRTVPRRGYMFVAETVPLGNADESPAAALQVSRRRPAVLYPALGAALLLAIGLVGWGGGFFARSPPAASAPVTVAVLPFTAAGEQGVEEWLADGIAEDIMTAVSRFHDIRVIARNSSFRYRGDNHDLTKIGEDLRAQFVLTGTVRRSGEQLRITVQLAEAASGVNRWAQRYDRPYAELFAMQDDIADNVAAQLVGHAREATVARLRARPPERLDAYELTLRARRAYRTFTRESAIEARALAERAIAIDPEYAAPWEVLAAALMQFYIQPYGQQMSRPVLQEALTAAEKSVSLDPNFATGFGMLGFVQVWAREHDASIASLERGLALNPNDVTVLTAYANVLTFAGEPSRSVAMWERAEQLDPFSPGLSAALHSLAYVMLGDFTKALPLARTCAQRGPNLFACQIYRAIAAHELGLAEEAEAAAKRLLEINPRFGIARHFRMAPFRSEADAARLADLMRRAGLPE